MGVVGTVGAAVTAAVNDVVEEHVPLLTVKV
jgi:hypothetical protein